MRAIAAFGAHCDDLPLSIGQLLAGRSDAVAVTVFGGDPPADVELTPYDEVTGFKSSRAAMHVRRAEDVEAMSILAAKSVHLPFVDSQYGVTTEVGDVAAAVAEILDGEDFDYVVTCLAVLHPDHRLVRDAVLQAMRGRETPLYLFEDLPNAVLHPEAVTEAMDELKFRGYTLDLTFVGTGSVATKMDALWSYKSQLNLPDFENRHCFLVPERFWLATRNA